MLVEPSVVERRYHAVMVWPREPRWLRSRRVMGFGERRDVTNPGRL